MAWTNINQNELHEKTGRAGTKSKTDVRGLCGVLSVPSHQRQRYVIQIIQSKIIKSFFDNYNLVPLPAIVKYMTCNYRHFVKFNLSFSKNSRVSAQ